MLPKAILFDLDDTIISFDGASDLAWELSCNLFVKNAHTSFDGSTLLERIDKVRRWYWGDPVRHRIGRMNMTEARREIVKMALRELQNHDEAKATQMADSYSKLQEELICLFPDSIATLDKLKGQGIRMALIKQPVTTRVDAKPIQSGYRIKVLRHPIQLGKR